MGSAVRAVYVAATGKNVGKSTTSIGLLHLFRSAGLRTGFMKPVGQTTIGIDGMEVDKDALLMKLIFDLPDDLSLMSTVKIPRGFTTDFLRHRERHSGMGEGIAAAFEEIARDKDVVVVEGTGHAGVGSVLGLSNATVARMLGIPVLLVVGGGIGRSIDELVLNAALFEREGAEVFGVLVNKVLEEKLDRVRQLVSSDLRRRGLAAMGFVPFRPSLSMPHVHQVCMTVGAEIVSGEEEMTEYVGNVAIAAMSPRGFIGRLAPGTLEIVPGDRVDNLLVAISYHLLGGRRRTGIAGILLTGGVLPDRSVLEWVRQSGIPLMMSERDTYDVASRVVSMTVKTQSTDLDKIETIQSLYREHVRLDELRDGIGV